MPAHLGEGIFLSSSLRLLVQVPTSSRNTLTDTPRSIVLAAIWATLSPVMLTHKINHHIQVACFSPVKLMNQERWPQKTPETGAVSQAMLMSRRGTPSPNSTSLFPPCKSSLFQKISCTSFWSPCKDKISLPEETDSRKKAG